MLAELPADHPLRNMTLYEASAEYRNTVGDGMTWHPITKQWEIAKVTYNKLGGTWIAYNEWRA